jgi:hypothetical protein
MICGNCGMAINKGMFGGSECFSCYMLRVTVRYGLSNSSDVKMEEKKPEAPKEALRFNEGKTPYAYVPMDLLDGAAKVMQYGAAKYRDSENFRKGYSDLLSPLSSVMRHLVEVQRSIHTNDLDNTKGYLLDKESGEAHIHHLLTSVMLLIHSMRLKGYKV